MDLGSCGFSASWHYAAGIYLLFAGNFNHVGEVPPEAAALFTIPSADSVMASTLSQFSTIGLLVLVLAG